MKLDMAKAKERADDAKLPRPITGAAGPTLGDTTGVTTLGAAGSDPLKLCVELLTLMTKTRTPGELRAVRNRVDAAIRALHALTAKKQEYLVAREGVVEKLQAKLDELKEPFQPTD